MAIPPSVLELIGNTPMIRAQHLDTGVCDLYLKLESANPGGSIKDRVALSMILAAEKRGEIKPGDTLVDATSGNTGIGLALVARQKGYGLTLVVPDTTSREKVFNLKAMGADVAMARADAAEGAPEHYRSVAAKIAAEIGDGFFIDHFGNPDNVAAHEYGTGPEILRQMEGRLDAVVVGCGSGGTLSGLSRALKSASPATELILADPVGSVLAAQVGGQGIASDTVSWMVDGIGGRIVPPLADLAVVNKAYSVKDAESFLAARQLLAEEGVLAGASAGAQVAAALKYCREQVEPKRVVVLICESGSKYLSTIFNDDWMLDHGFLERPWHGDLRDLIQRPFDQKDTVVVAPGEPLTDAYQRMKLYDVSQLPVIDDGELVGILDESDVLLHVYGDEERFGDAVSTAMVGKLDRLDVKSPVEALLPVFERGQVAIVTDGGRFLGLITRIDLLNYLRRRA